MSLDAPGTIAAEDHSDAPYIVRTVLENVALSEDGQNHDISISCVEFWDGNLYIGTTAGEVLHYVQIPAESALDLPAFILATRLQPGAEDAAPAKISNGVQQLVILPQASTICILCNGTVYFYSIPELSPTSQIKVKNCIWIGGLDQDALSPQDGGDDTAVIMVCLRTKIRLLRVSISTVKLYRDIELGNCLAASRRGNIACAANAVSYSLLDIAEKAQIPLVDIASMPQNQDVHESDNAGRQQEERLKPETERSTLTAGLPTVHVEPAGETQSQDVSKVETSKRDQAESQSPNKSETVSAASEERARDSAMPLKDASPVRGRSREHGSEAMTIPHSKITDSRSTSALSVKKTTPNPLMPHILSPTSTEFLLTTGTTREEPGVGMFVNLDGDVVGRATLEFHRYPESLVIDNDTTSEDASLPDTFGFVLAVMERHDNGLTYRAVEIQRWDQNSDDGHTQKYWLHIPQSTNARQDDLEKQTLGIQDTTSYGNISIPEVAERFGSSWIRLRQSESASAHSGEMDIPISDRSEIELLQRFSVGGSKILLWLRDKIMWVVQNPLALRLDARLQRARKISPGMSETLSREAIKTIFNELRGREPQSELEFFTFNYIRQKTSLALYLALTSRSLKGLDTHDQDRSYTQEALTSSELDPRVVLEVVPSLREEIVQSVNGVWMMNGLQQLLEEFHTQSAFDDVEKRAAPDVDMLHMIRQYLQAWQRKKGFGSIADGDNIFATVDAALLHVLLILDQDSPRGRGKKGSTRAELYNVVDRGLICFDRAVDLLEQYKRLYVLSRLYRKSPTQVLATWKRMVEGEEDAGGEFPDGEQKVGEYLTTLKDRELVQEYGSWLAARNPKLGVRIFAHDDSKIKFEAKDVIRILEERAPEAVKEYLEYLVFGKLMAQYANDLIYYYLDSVLAELESSTASRDILHNTYDAYRALKAPKPTYSQFAADNAIDAEWWSNRLRLLQLLGGSHGTASQYDTAQVVARVKRFEAELVPEMIILDGRQGRHKEAIHLLAHDLGDFDTAISYCANGGMSLYGPQSDQHSGLTSGREEQISLFGHLLDEFLEIDDEQDRMVQTSEVLSRYANWFDVTHVLTSLPDSWSVELISGFLESAFRSVVSERHETTITRALLGLENLKTSLGLIEKIETFKPVIVPESQTS